MKTPLLCALALSLVALVLVPAASAQAAPPVVTSVSPLKAKVGERLTLRGRNFIPGPNRNTVIFMSNYGPTVFVKARSATRTSLQVDLPARLEAGMRRGADGGLLSNRFRLRVVARQPAASFTPARMSPVISPRSTAPPNPDADDDGDFLSARLEGEIRTDPARKDTDGDGLEDGWEYYAAKDLNVKAIPYPGARPFPNALDPSDANVDFDGDFLRSHEEHALWKATGRHFDRARLSNGVEDSPLGYSDGTQTSRPEQAPTRPAFTRTPGHYDDARWPEPSYPSFLSRDGDGTWSDDERDVDRDGLSNVSEEHLEMSKRVWNAWLAQRCDPAVKPWEERDGDYYGSFSQRPFAEPTMLDADVDGDGLLDAEDDQDNDDVPNYSEMDFECADDPVFVDADSDGAADDLNPTYEPRVHPYNPCAPDGGFWVPFPGTPMSRTCPRTKPLEG